MLKQTFKMAWESVRSNKLRSFLTMLGIIIGVMAITVLISLVNSATDSITDQIESLGTNMLVANVLNDNGKPLNTNDIKEIPDICDNISETAPAISLTVPGSFGTNDVMFSVTGTTPEYGRICGIDIKYGRFLRQADVTNRSAVIIIDETAAEKLYGSITEAVGQHLNLNGQEFLVVGVQLEDEASKVSMQAMMGQSGAYIPYSLAASMANAESVTMFYAAPESDDVIDNAEVSLSQYLEKRFRDEDGFIVINQSTVINLMDSIMDTMTTVLACIAGISLLVGGIGIMNIMLVSVTERTREIGIRKAIGASRSGILTQFLIEALMISLIGGVIGLALSWIILEIMGSFAGDAITIRMSVSVIILAFMFSLAIGVIFGIYPANKASKLHPIDALRHE